ncbi:MAG: RNA helicase required for poly(A+) mRNA export [Watsoniomyces obsoletus]|nr:MAG: RNA helicase required for poly(A+) mRNA export [Watsoniomyces obsoletus]
MFSITLPRQSLSRGVSGGFSPSFATRTVVAPARSWSCSGHQRRKSSSSSSKPSNPSRGPGVHPQQQQQETSSERSRTSNGDGPTRRLSTRLGRRKANKEGVDAQDVAFSKLPSVPNTNHLHPADIAVSAFFSLHRPISITNSIPSSANSNAFEDIFRSRSTRQMQSSEVINTLSSAVRSLEGAGVKNNNHRSYDQATDNEFRAAITSVSVSNSDAADQQVRHLDGDPNTTGMDLKQLIARRFVPFRPPPVPSSESEAASTSQDENQDPWVSLSTDQHPDHDSSTIKAHQRMFSTVLTIVESTHANGTKSYTARTSPITSRNVSSRRRQNLISSGHQHPHHSHHHRLSSSSPSSGMTYLERKRFRQTRWMDMRNSSNEVEQSWQQQGEMSEGPGGEVQENNEMVEEDDEGGEGERNGNGNGNGMYAISVRRQRKLKMKKHKYKKLMRRTRNLRRRLDRT